MMCAFILVFFLNKFQFRFVCQSEITQQSERIASNLAILGYVYCHWQPIGTNNVIQMLMLNISKDSRTFTNSIHL